MSKRQFVSTIILLIMANLVIKSFFIFGIDLQVQQRVGQSSYGLYFILLNLCYIFQIINDFGLNLIHNTDTAEHGYVRKERWSQMLRLKIVLAIIYAIVVVAVASALGYMYAWNLLGWLILNNILVSLILILRAGISGSARYKTEAMISVMDKALMILFCGFLLVNFSTFKIEWFVWSQTASLVITAIVAWLISSKFISHLKASLSGLDLRSIFREALPYALAIFLMYMYTRSDSVMIEQLLPNGTTEVGIYAAGFRLLDAANMIAFLFGPLLIPMYVRLRKDKNETIQLMQLASGMMIFMTAIISIGSFFWAREIMFLCYGHNDETWVMPFRFLILSHIPIGLMYIFSSYLTAMKQMGHQNKLFVFSVIINLGLNFVLIPRLGILGAAITMVITQTITTAGLIFLSHQFLSEKMNVSLAIRSGIYMVVLITAGFFLESFPLQWVVEITFFCVIALVAAFLLKLLQWESFIDLVRKRQEGLS